MIPGVIWNSSEVMEVNELRLLFWLMYGAHVSLP